MNEKIGLKGKLFTFSPGTVVQISLTAQCKARIELEFRLRKLDYVC